VANNPLPRPAVWALRAVWALARLLPPGLVRAGGRALFSKSYGRLVAAAADPRGAQRARLREILERNRNTEFGRRYDFPTIRDFDRYRARVPIHTYDDLEPYISRMIDGEQNVLVSDPVTFFARTSGTTGSPKHIPITDSFVNEFRAGRRVWSRAVSQAFPGLVRGHLLTVHAAGVEGRTPAGVPYGSITVALAGGREEEIDNPLEGIPRGIFRLADFETKYYLTLRAALDVPISLIGALNPSTLYVLCQRLSAWGDRLAKDVATGAITPPGEVPDPLLARLHRRARPRPKVAARLWRSLDAHGLVRPVDVWPRLCGALAWKGGSAPFYLDKLQPYLADLDVMDYGYVATEGNFNIVQDAGDGRGVVGVVGHALEFVPEAAHGDPAAETKLVDELEVGQRYAIIITGSHGLYRYDINDIVEVMGRDGGLPQIRFVHKGGNMISMTGEKVGEAHVLAAARAAFAEVRLEPNGFLVTARLVDPPHYCLALEAPAEAPEAQLRALLRSFDAQLGRVNIEYAAKRESLRLAPPRLLQVAEGAFVGLLARRIEAGAPDAHAKLPHLWRDPAVLDELGAAQELSLEEQPA